MLSAFLLLLAASLGLVHAQDPSPLTTATSSVVAILTDVGTFPTSFIGAVIGVESCSTTYELVCANGEDSRCYSDLDTGTLTSIIGPSTQIADAVSMLDSTTSSYHAECSLAGTNSAVCTSTFLAVLNGKSSIDSGFPVTSTYTEFVKLNVPITSGAQMALGGQSVCSSPASTTGSITDSTTDTSSSSSDPTESSTTTAQALATSHHANNLDTGILLFIGMTAVLSFSLGVFL